MEMYFDGNGGIEFYTDEDLEKMSDKEYEEWEKKMTEGDYWFDYGDWLEKKEEERKEVEKKRLKKEEHERYCRWEKIYHCLDNNIRLKYLAEIHKKESDCREKDEMAFFKWELGEISMKYNMSYNGDWKYSDEIDDEEFLEKYIAEGFGVNVFYEKMHKGEFSYSTKWNIGKLAEQDGYTFDKDFEIPNDGDEEAWIGRGWMRLDYETGEAYYSEEGQKRYQENYKKLREFYKERLGVTIYL